MPQFENWSKIQETPSNIEALWKGFYDNLYVAVLNTSTGYTVDRIIDRSVEEFRMVDTASAGTDIGRQDYWKEEDGYTQFDSKEEAVDRAREFMKNNKFGVHSAEVKSTWKDRSPPLSEKGLALMTLEGFYESHIPFLIDGEGHENGTPYRMTVDWVSEENLERDERDYEIARGLDMYIREGLVESLYADGTDIQSVEDYKDMKDRVEIMTEATREI